MLEGSPALSCSSGERLGSQSLRGMENGLLSQGGELGPLTEGAGSVPEPGGVTDVTLQSFLYLFLPV